MDKRREMMYECGRLDRAIFDMGEEDVTNYNLLCRFLYECTDERRSELLAELRHWVESHRQDHSEE